ncbi:MAG: Trm112 family protein [Acidobacteria bacterium]|nr:Trm112 family protein [Acidobacteriota bacterium]
MPISEDLLEILCCPRTKVPVQVLPADQLASLNERIAQGGVTHQDGSPVATPLQEGLITEDGETVYRIEDDIPVMLVDQGIPGRFVNQA